LLCSFSVDVTRDTVADKLEDWSGSHLLGELYKGGMIGVDIIAQIVATSGLSGITSLGKGLVAVVKAFGDDFLRIFIKNYSDDAIRALATYGDAAGKLLLSAGDDIGKALSTLNGSSRRIIGRNLIDKMVDQWNGGNSSSNVPSSWDDVLANLENKPSAGYNESAVEGVGKLVTEINYRPSSGATLTATPERRQRYWAIMKRICNI
jgi:hypothetical protein